MSIEFRCGQCQKLLRVPDESAGKTARCPQCQALMQVPAAGSLGEAAPPAMMQVAGPSGSPPPPKPPANPFGDSGGASPFGAAQPSMNPYASPAGISGQPLTAPILQRPINPQQVEVGPILNYAMHLWQQNLGLLLGVTVTIVGISYAIGLLFGLPQFILEQNDEPEIAMGVYFLGQIVSNVAQIFLGIGQAQVALKMARGLPVSYTDLFGGGPRFFPVLGVSILGGIMIAAGFLLLIVPGIILLLIFWPFYYLVVDQKATVMESFSVASRITNGNWGTAVLLWLLSIGIMLLGCLALCIGMLFAMPLVTLLWAVAYLMMAGQISTQPLIRI